MAYSVLVRMNLEYSMFSSRQHYFDKTDISWRDLNMDSQSGQQSENCIRYRKVELITIFILKTIGVRMGMIALS